MNIAHSIGVLRSLFLNFYSRRNVMMDKVKDVNGPAGFDDGVTAAAESLKRGKVIAVPTDTIYGIAALVQSTPAMSCIYDIKNRSSKKPIAICVSDVADISKWAKVTVSNQLLSDLLPGPVTVVFERRPELNPQLNPGTTLVGVRVPDHRFIRAVVRSCGEPLALTSANVSDSQSTLNIQEFSCLWPRLDLIFDGGILGDTLQARQGSTVVDLSKHGMFTVIRTGSAYENTVKILCDKYGLKEDQKQT